MTKTRFRGWDVLGGSFVNAMVIAGASIYSFGLFVEPLEAEFNLTREQTYLGIIVFYLSMAMWAVTIGKLLTRVSARTLSFLGAIAFALGFALISVIQSPKLDLLIVFTLIGFGFTAAGPFMANALATNWFSRMRGRALGIAAVATSAGGFAMVPLFAYLMDQFGWRQATLIMGLGAGALIILFTWFFVISKPEDIGQTPDGDALIADDETRNIKTVRIFRNKNFWLIAIACGLLFGSDQALLTSLIPYGQEQGFSRQKAAFVMSVVTFSAIAGKLVIGALAEKYDKRALFAVVCLSNIAFLITVLASPSYLVLLLVGGIVGIAIGGIYPVWTSITADVFGRDQFAPAIGAMNLITVSFILVSLFLTGYTHKLTGDYALAFKIFLPQVILAAIIMFFVRTKNDGR